VDFSVTTTEPPRSGAGPVLGHYALAGFVAHYHGERNHQGIGNELIDHPPWLRTGDFVRRRERVGGLLSYYYRAAA
jgi:putative transposase